MSYYPVFIDLQDKDVLVVGGGAVAQRKIETLLEHKARPRIVSRHLTPFLKEMVKEGRVEFLGDDFLKDHLNGAFMVIAATNDARLNKEVSTLAQDRGLLVNAVDQPSDCNFIVPSILKRGDLTIAVSTSGKSPALAKKVRRDLEGQFGEEYGNLLNLMGHLRKEIIGLGFAQSENKRIFKELIDSDILMRIKGKDWKKVASIVNSILHKKISPDDIMCYLKVES